MWIQPNPLNVKRVAEKPLDLECRYPKSVLVQNLEENVRYIIVQGEETGIHIRDEYLDEARPDK